MCELGDYQYLVTIRESLYKEVYCSQGESYVSPLLT